MINPLVETLFDEDKGSWKNFWYENLVPKWYSYAIGSIIGLNRFLIMSNFLKLQINTENLSESISSRQVKKCEFIYCEFIFNFIRNI